MSNRLIDETNRNPSPFEAVACKDPDSSFKIAAENGSGTSTFTDQSSVLMIVPGRPSSNNPADGVIRPDPADVAALRSLASGTRIVSIRMNQYLLHFQMDRPHHEMPIKQSL